MCVGGWEGRATVCLPAPRAACLRHSEAANLPTPTTCNRHLHEVQEVPTPHPLCRSCELSSRPLRRRCAAAARSLLHAARWALRLPRLPAVQHLNKVLKAEREEKGSGHTTKSLKAILLMATSRPWELLAAGKTPQVAVFAPLLRVPGCAAHAAHVGAACAGAGRAPALSTPGHPPTLQRA